MEPEQTTPVVESSDKFENLKKVTPLSKYLAMTLFIIMPFLGGWIGYTYAPEKVVEVYTISPDNQFSQDEVANSLSPASLLPNKSLAVTKSSGPTSTTTLQIDLSGFESIGEEDAGINILSTQIVNTTGRLVKLDWTVTLEAYEPSHLSEMGLKVMNERTGQMIRVVPASEIEGDFSGVREYNGSIDLDSYGIAIDFFAGDKLSVQLWEDYDDLPDRADGVWKKGLLTATFEHL